MKRRMFFLALIAVIYGGIILAALSVPASAQNKSENLVKVYYFHGKVRCSTCKKIEHYISDAMGSKFKKLISEGKVKFEVIDYSKKKNQHFEKNYDLFTQTMIVSLVKNGKESKWKSSDKIFELSSNQDKFTDYVESEVNEYLKGL